MYAWTGRRTLQLCMEDATSVLDVARAGREVNVRVPCTMHADCPPSAFCRKQHRVFGFQYKQFCKSRPLCKPGRSGNSVDGTCPYPMEAWTWEGDSSVKALPEEVAQLVGDEYYRQLGLPVGIPKPTPFGHH